MKVGYIMDRGDGNYRYQETWVEGNPEQSFFRGTKISDKTQHHVQTFCCPKCGFLESYAVLEENYDVFQPDFSVFFPELASYLAINPR